MTGNARQIAVAMVLAVSLWLVPGSVSGKDHGPKRAKPVDLIVIHAIGGPECKNGATVFSGAPGDAKKWKEYFEKDATLGIHYVIDRSGVVESSIPEDETANHAQGHNDSSLGIELVNNGDGTDPFPAAQIGALNGLLKGVLSRTGLSKSAIKRHSEIDTRTFACGGVAVKQKQDPGSNFPWDEALKDL